MSEQHISSAFDRELEAIQARIMKMGGLVEAAIIDAARSLETRDVELAEKVRIGDKAIDELEDIVNEQAAQLIALRSPTAIDLRLVLSVLKISGNLAAAQAAGVCMRNASARNIGVGFDAMMSLLCGKIPSQRSGTIP